MSEENAFLRAVQANPEDDAPRLVYADWLEETGDPRCARQAAFLRDTVALQSADAMAAPVIGRRLQELALELDRSWLAAVSKLALEECWLKFEFQCPMRWERLTPTDDPTVRTCAQCRQRVYYCRTLEEARAYADRGECIAVDLAVRRRPDDLRPQPDPLVRTLGRVLPGPGD